MEVRVGCALRKPKPGGHSLRQAQINSPSRPRGCLNRGHAVGQAPYHYGWAAPGSLIFSFYAIA